MALNRGSRGGVSAAGSCRRRSGRVGQAALAASPAGGRRCCPRYPSSNAEVWSPPRPCSTTATGNDDPVTRTTAASRSSTRSGVRGAPSTQLPDTVRPPATCGTTPSGPSGPRPRVRCPNTEDRPGSTPWLTASAPAATAATPAPARNTRARATAAADPSPPPWRQCAVERRGNTALTGRSRRRSCDASVFGRLLTTRLCTTALVRGTQRPGAVMMIRGLTRRLTIHSTPDLMPVLSRGKHRTTRRRGRASWSSRPSSPGSRGRTTRRAPTPCWRRWRATSTTTSTTTPARRLAPLIPRSSGSPATDPRVDAWIAREAALAALPITGAERQGVAAVGLLRCERVLNQLEGRDKPHVDPRTRTRLDAAPHARDWARGFTALGWGSPAASPSAARPRSCTRRSPASPWPRCRRRRRPRRPARARHRAVPRVVPPRDRPGRTRPRGARSPS